MLKIHGAITGLVTCAFVATPANGELTVVTTIGPIHSLVEMVGQERVDNTLLIDSGASPHFYALSPSQSAALADAEIVFMVGDGLERWLSNSLNSLANDADIIELGSVEGTTRLDIRESGVWDKNDGHDDNHGHGDVDPHLWLAPENAIVWLQQIADVLSKHDPDGELVFQSNANQAASRLQELRIDVAQQINRSSNEAFIVFHDAYQYFENSFGIHSVGSVLLDDTRKPSAARVKQLRDQIELAGVRCIFIEPQFSPVIVETLREDFPVNVAEMDPIGANLDPGPDLYPQLIANLADSMTSCMELPQSN